MYLFELSISKHFKSPKTGATYTIIQIVNMISTHLLFTKLATICNEAADPPAHSKAVRHLMPLILKGVCTNMGLSLLAHSKAIRPHAPKNKTQLGCAQSWVFLYQLTAR